MIDYEKMMTHVRSHPYPLVFATISGAHLYGFPSPDSDFDLRGVHLLPFKTVVSLYEGELTVEKEGIYDGLEIDLVTHDAAKFLGLMLKRNGYVLEQLLSPLVVYATPEYEELKSLAPGCITRHHAHHYLGFAATQWRLFEKESPPKGTELGDTRRQRLQHVFASSALQTVRPKDVASYNNSWPSEASKDDYAAI